MEEKKRPDRELIRASMREIIRNKEAHERDRVAAGKLLRQTHIDEDEESPNGTTDQFEPDQIALLKSCGLMPPGCDETEEQSGVLPSRAISGPQSTKFSLSPIR